MSTNGMNGSGNGKDPDDKKIVKFPSLAERDRIKRAEREEEERWRKEYQKKSQANRGEPFFKFGNIPPFTKALIAAMVVVHLILYLLLDSADRFQAMTILGFIPGQYTNMDSWGWQWSALISPLAHILIHGSWMHLFFNVVMGLVLGMYFEKMYGSRSTAKFIITCTLAGALTFFIFHPFSNTPVVGASGAISGLFGALIYLTIGQNKNHPMTQRFGKYGPWPVLIFWGLFIVVPGLLMGGATAWEAHLGGYVCGIAILVAQQRRLIRFL
jgi:membrane associated rhomboid family serine protease